MAFDVLDEHEQGELVQKWLRENALAIIVGVALGLLLIFGWQQWKTHRLRGEIEAAARYQALSDAIAANQHDQIGPLAAAIRKDFAGTAYASFAALAEASEAARRNDLDAAATALESVRAASVEAAIKHLATLRLARVRYGKGEGEAALQLLDALPKDQFVAAAGELRGDILRQLGRNDSAREAYQAALAAPSAQGAERQSLQSKLDDLGAPDAAAVPAPAPAVAQKAGA